VARTFSDMVCIWFAGTKCHKCQHQREAWSRS